MSVAQAPKCTEIGNLFVGQYYRHLVSSPDTAHNFYHAEADFCRRYKNAPSEQFVGHDKIKAFIAQSNYQNCKFLIDTIDSQEKSKGEIVVLVTGMMIDAEKVVRPFCQTFVLEAVSGTRYLVRNDVLRFLSSDLLNIGEPAQKAEQAVQPEVNEQPPVAELKHEEAPQTHVDMGTQVELPFSEPPKEPEQPQPVEAEQPQPQTPTQIVQPPQPQKKQAASRRPETKAHEQPDPSKPPKPRAWAHVAAGARPAGQPSVPATTVSTPPTENAAAAAAAAPDGEEEIATTPASATAVAEKSKPRFSSEVMNALYVSNLGGSGCDAEEIKILFSKYGKVKKVSYTPNSSFCFVEYETVEAADKALKGGPLRPSGSTEDLKLERRKRLENRGGPRGGRGRGGPGGRGRGGPPRSDSARTEPRTDRTDRAAPRPREGNDRRGPDRGRSRGGGRGAGRGGGTAPAAAATS